MTHSKIGASSMYRWAVCPGSVRMSEGIELTPSAYAEEGTEAHEYAAKILRYEVVFIHDIEMREAVRTYVDFVQSLSGIRLIEHKFDLSAIHPGCYGTADAVVYDKDTHKLWVIDFKYGAGIYVGVENNPQLRYYALGAMLTCGFEVETVEMVIVQPRYTGTNPIRSEKVASIDLLDFSADLKEYAVATEQPNAPLVAGEHCRFCPAAPTCPELQSKAQAIAKVEFKASLPYDPAKLKLALDSREIVKAWLKAIDEFAYSEAEAGLCAPGYKLVDKRPTRKWKSEGDVIEYLQDLGVKGIYAPQELKSPAQMEKIVDKELLADLIVSESSGRTLVPDSDKREPSKSSAKEDFNGR